MMLGIGLGHVVAPEFFATYSVASTEALRRFNEGVALRLYANPADSIRLIGQRLVPALSS
jgi:hypothetical protein